MPHTYNYGMQNLSGQLIAYPFTVDWEYFIGSKLAWTKYSTGFNMKLACMCIKITVEVATHILCI